MFDTLLPTGLDLIFPRRCTACRDSIGVSHDWCEDCEQQLRMATAVPACPTCASTYGPYGLVDDRCRKCQGRRPPIRAMVRVGEYKSVLGSLLRRYKYGRQEYLERRLARWLAEAVNQAPWLDQIEAVTSVPTHWRHRLGRPLYAADALASLLARRCCIPFVRLLKRTRGGPHQAGLSYSARQENVRGAFALRPGISMHDARILLVDDARTTGATIKECAKMLRAGGAADVYAAVLVTVRDDDPGGATIDQI